MKNGYYNWLIATLFLVLAGFLVCFVFWPYPDKDLGPNMVTAFLGVFLSGAITLVLLKGQTKAEETKDKNAKVFEEKLKIYQDFLETLNQVLKDGKVTPDEALKLKFKISSMALHTDSQRINKISDSIREIFNAINEDKNQNSKVIENVNLSELFNIVIQFSHEIYGEDKKNDKTLDKLKGAISNFEEINRLLYESKPISSENSKIYAEVASNGVDNKDELIQLLYKSGWEYSDDVGHPIIFEKQDMTIKLERDDNWYFSVALAKGKYDSRDRRDVYKGVRRLFGGYFNTNADWGWYNYLEDEYKALKQQEFADKLSNNTEFRKYLYDFIIKSAAFLNKVCELLAIVPNLKKTKDWDTYLYLIEGECCLVNQSEFAGRPFIDLVAEEQESYRVEMSIREDEHLQDFKQRINDDLSFNSDGRWFEEFESMDEAIECVNTLIARIEQAYS